MTLDEAIGEATGDDTAHVMYIGMVQYRTEALYNAITYATNSIMCDFRRYIVLTTKFVTNYPFKDNMLYAVRQDLE